MRFTEQNGGMTSNSFEQNYFVIKIIPQETVPFQILGYIQLSICYFSIGSLSHMAGNLLRF